MRSGDADASQLACKFEIDMAVFRGRMGQLGDLVILGDVRVEIILTIEASVPSDVAIEQHPGQRGQAEGFGIRDRENAGHAKANGAHVGVGW